MSVSSILYKFAFCALLLLAPLPPVIAQSPDDIELHLPRLHEVFANDFSFGVILSYPHIGLPDDPRVPGQGNVVSPTGGFLVQHHMNFMSPGNNMKAQNTVNLSASAQAYNNATTQAERDSINVHPVVRFNGNMIAQLNWAARNEFQFRVHTLVWHSQTPGTGFFREGYAASGERLTPELMDLRMRNYIRSVIKLLHEGWPGMVTAVDVVNEKILDSGAFRFAENEWYETFGSTEYVYKAFEYTREFALEFGENQMMLYYNDFNMHNPSKANGVVSYFKPLYDAGLLDGIGMQQHDAWNSPSTAQWLASYNKFSTISNEIAITELDVNPVLPNPGPERLIQQANQYAMLFKLFLDHSYRSGRGKIVNVTKDGLNDQLAFVQNAHIFDANNLAKPAFYAIVDVGIYYNALDTLVAYAENLSPTDAIHPQRWDELEAALQVARITFTREYSPNVSAAVTFKTSYEKLSEAVDNLTKEPTSIDGNDNRILSFELLQNYPNPFNPVTNISYRLSEAGAVRLEVFDITGRRMATLVDESQLPGSYSVTWDGQQAASGVYIYRISAGNRVSHRQMLLIK